MRTLIGLFVCGCLVMSLGCAMCDSSQDCKYAAYGGVVERLDMVNGRVNSVFNPTSVARTDGNSEMVLAPGVGTPTPAEVDQEEAHDEETPGVSADANGPTVSSENVDGEERSGEQGNAEESLDSIDTPSDESEVVLPEADGSPSLDDLFDDLDDAT